jgi:hypothetical protein
MPISSSRLRLRVIVICKTDAAPLAYSEAFAAFDGAVPSYVSVTEALRSCSWFPPDIIIVHKDISWELAADLARTLRQQIGDYPCAFFAFNDAATWHGRACFERVFDSAMTPGRARFMVRKTLSLHPFS